MSEEVTNQGWYVLPLMFITASFLSTFWIAEFFWKRRDFYRKAAKIPGPRGYPLIGNAWDFYGLSRSALMQAWTRVFEKNPTVFRIWLGTKLFTAVSKPEHAEIILNQCIGRDKTCRFFNSVMESGLMAAPVPVWKVHRKLMNPTFNQKILDSYIEVFNERAKILTNVLSQKLSDTNLDIWKVMSSFAVDVVCETAMGVRLNTQTTPNDYGSWFDEFLAIVCIRMISVQYHSDWIFRWSNYKQRLDYIVPRINEFTRKVVREKEKLFKEKKEQLEKGEVVGETTRWKCFLEHMMELTDNGTILTEKELMDEANTILGAGSETNATTLSLFLMIMGMFPEVQKQIYEEVIDVFGYDRDVTLDDLSRLQFMDRCLKETMRIFPPVPFITRHTPTDIQVGDTILPANCCIIVGVIQAHRSEKYWKDPWKFDPDRFLPEEVAKRHPYLFLPFGGGPRNCIGYRFAVMVMKTAIVHIFRKFVMRTEYKTFQEIKLNLGIVIKPTEGFKLSLTPRE